MHNRDVHALSYLKLKINRLKIIKRFKSHDASEYFLNILLPFLPLETATENSALLDKSYQLECRIISSLMYVLQHIKRKARSPIPCNICIYKIKF